MKDNNSDLFMAFLAKNVSDAAENQMMEMATMLHDTYIDFVEAGFTSKQAMELLKTIIAESVRVIK